MDDIKSICEIANISNEEFGVLRVAYRDAKRSNEGFISFLRRISVAAELLAEIYSDDE